MSTLPVTRAKHVPWSLSVSLIWKRKKDQKTIYLEIFNTGGNVLLIKLFAEVKHVGGEQGLAVCPSEGETEVNETQV